MKKTILIIIICEIFSLHSYIYSQNFNDSDSLIPGNIYNVKMKSGKEFLFKFSRSESDFLFFFDTENEQHKLKIKRIQSCLNVLTNNSFSNSSRFYWIINLDNSYYYDSTVLTGSKISKDTIEFLSNEILVRLPVKKIQGVEIYFHSGDLESDPMNLFPFYLAFADKSTQEYDLSELNNMWKSAYIKFLIYLYNKN